MREFPSYIKVDLAELWRTVVRYWWILLLIFVFVAAAGYFISKRQKPVYESTARLLAAQSSGFAIGQFQSLPTASPLDSQAYIQAALSTQVIADTFNLGAGPQNQQVLDNLRKKLRVRAIDGRQTSVIILNARDTSPANSTKLANAWADALRRWDDQRVRSTFRLNRQALEAQLKVLNADISRPGATAQDIDARRTQIAGVQRDLDLIRALEQGATGQLSLLDAADLPSKPVAPRPLFTAILAGILALVLGFLVLLLREATTRRVRGSEEAAEISGLPVLGEFPRVPSLQGRDLPREAASYLRTYVNRSLMDEHPKVVAITSPESGEGKSSVSLALAKAYARAGKRTLLIDLDLRKPVLHKEFGLTSGADIISVLRDPMFTLSAHQVEAGLHVLPCLQILPDSAELLAEHFRPFLRRLLEVQDWDVVVIDTAPILEVTDTLIIAPQVSGLVVVVSAGSTNRRRLNAALDSLKRIGARVIGVAVNNLRSGEGLTASSRGYGSYGSKYRVTPGSSTEERDIRQTSEW
ncbi:MAG: polysaccharide biosynthesis tyrosine autokinase [Thermaceae bacterium]|nr:polysaccharide biosynthesis tyrosine autokinase [Thermaceae bacterium]